MNLWICGAWICLGAAVGGFGSKIMETYTHASPLGNFSFGILGALVAGIVTRRWLGAGLGYAGDFVGLGGAFLGSSVGIFCWQAFARHRRA